MVYVLVSLQYLLYEYVSVTVAVPTPSPVTVILEPDLLFNVTIFFLLTVHLCVYPLPTSLESNVIVSPTLIVLVVSVSLATDIFFSSESESESSSFSPDKLAVSTFLSLLSF